LGASSIDIAAMRAYAGLRRPVSSDGLYPVDVARILARYRGVPVGQSDQALSHGPEEHTGPLQASDALNLRDWRIYHELAMRLIARARMLYAEESHGIELDATVYALDATTIDLCLSLFDWAPFCAAKAAVKMHTLLDLCGAIPACIHISEGKMHEVNVLDFMPLEAGAFHVMDRGYLDFARLFKLHQAGAFFISRAKRGMSTRRVYSSQTVRTTGVICDKKIALNDFYASKHYPIHLRRIRYKDPDSGKTLIFLTNNMTLPPLIIVALCKRRWQVELFFKWIKQHLRIKRFLGASENAVKTQIWSAVSIYTLTAIIKKELNLDASLYTLLQILSFSVFEKTPLLQAFSTTLNKTEPDDSCNQLNLIDF
jgi:hypothetical protein